MHIQKESQVVYNSNLQGNHNYMRNGNTSLIVVYNSNLQGNHNSSFERLP